MAENDRPLPTPPRSRFGRQVPGAEDSEGPLTADRLTQAAAEGRLEEFLQHGIPEGGHARDLAMMMLGMSGMSAPGGAPGAAVTASGAPAGAPGIPAAAPDVPETGGAPGGTGSAAPPEVIAATMEGDVAGLMSLLRAEHLRRSGEGVPEGGAPAEAPSASVDAAAPQSAMGAAGGPQAGIDRVLVDELIRIAAENQVTVDWLVLRAVKLYLEEHRRTGRL